MGIFKSAKKLATGSESAKDAFTDCEKLYDDIDEYAFMPFDMIIETCEAIDTLLAQREEMQTLGLMKERVADIDRDMTRARTALKDLKKAHPEETLNPMVKCFGPAAWVASPPTPCRSSPASTPSPSPSRRSSRPTPRTSPARRSEPV